MSDTASVEAPQLAKPYHDWEYLNLKEGERRTFDNCALDRRKYAEFLISYLNGEGDTGYVLNLNGAWGSGKTEFVRRLYAELRTRDHPVVFIDAWTSDFAKEPLLVVGAELIDQLSHCTSRYNCPKDIERIKHWLGKATRAAVKGTAMAASIYTTGSPGVGNRVADTLIETFSGNPTTLTDQLVGNYKSQKVAMQMLRRHLSALVKTGIGTAPIYVIVDELDRCRPDYAIELLETIKHFFAVPGVVFIVSTHSEQLGHSIQASYGAKFDSEHYLRRFFDRRISLPEPSLSEYLLSTGYAIPGIDNPNVILGPQITTNEESFKYIEVVADLFGYKLRDVDQLLAKANACMTVINDEAEHGKHAVNFFGLLYALAEYDINLDLFRVRTIGSSIPFKSNISASEYIPLNDLSNSLGINKDVISNNIRAMFVTGNEHPKFKVMPMRKSTSHLINEEYGKAAAFAKECSEIVEGSFGSVWTWDKVAQLVELSANID